MTQDDTAPPGELILYASEDRQAQVQVRMAGSVADQAQIGELFGKDTRTVNEHLRNVFAEADGNLHTVEQAWQCNVISAVVN
jgi:hypothetical protein